MGSPTTTLRLLKNFSVPLVGWAHFFAFSSHDLRIGSILFPKEDWFYPDLWISADFRFVPLPGHFVIQRYGNLTLLLEKPCVILR